MYGGGRVLSEAFLHQYKISAIITHHQTTSALAADLWQQIPKQMKDSNTFLFPRQIKKYLLLKQMNCPNPVAFFQSIVHMCICFCLCAFGSFSCLPKIVTKQDQCLTRKPTVYLDTRHFLHCHLYLVFFLVSVTFYKYFI